MSETTIDETPAAAPAPASPVDAVYDEIGRYGIERHASIDAATLSLERAIAATRSALERGLPLNLTEAARRAGVSKQTLYNRLPADLVAARGGAPDGTPAAPISAGPDPEETTP